MPSQSSADKDGLSGMIRRAERHKQVVINSECGCCDAGVADLMICKKFEVLKLRMTLYHALRHVVSFLLKMETNPHASNINCVCPENAVTAAARAPPATPSPSRYVTGFSIAG